MFFLYFQTTNKIHENFKFYYLRFTKEVIKYVKLECVLKSCHLFDLLQYLNYE